MATNYDGCSDEQVDDACRVLSSADQSELEGKLSQCKLVKNLVAKAREDLRQRALGKTLLKELDKVKDDVEGFLATFALPEKGCNIVAKIAFQGKTLARLNTRSEMLVGKCDQLRACAQAVVEATSQAIAGRVKQLALVRAESFWVVMAP